MFSSLKKGALSGFFIVLTATFSAQTPLVEVYGNIADNNRDLVGVLVQVSQNGKTIVSTMTDPNGEYAFQIPLNGDYMAVVSREGYVSKKFTISTRGIPPEKVDKKFQPIGASISLFPKIEGVDYSLLNQPMMKFFFNTEDETFEYDEEHVKQMAVGLEQIREQEQAIKDKEAAREAEYRTLVKNGDKAFGKKEWKNSIASYQEALKMKPKELYPQEQITQINKIMGEQDAQAKLDAEAKAKLAAELAAKKAAEDAAAKARLDAEAAAKAKADKEAADRLAKEKSAADAKALADADARKKAEADALAKKQADDAAARSKAEADALLKKQEADALAKKQAEEAALKAKLAADAKSKADADALAKKQAADAAAKSKADAAAAEKAKAEKEASEKLAREKAEKEKADKLAKEKSEIANKANADALAKQQAADALQKRRNDSILAKSKADADAANKLAAQKAAADAKLLADAKAKADADELAKKQAAEATRLQQEKMLADALAKEKADKLAKDQADERKRKEAELAMKDKVTADASKGKSDKSIPPVLGADVNYNEAIRKGDNYFALKRYLDAKTSYERALSYKTNDQYAKEQFRLCEERLSAEANEIKDERQKQLLAKYPPGVTEEMLPGEGVVIVKRVLVKDRMAYVYEKKIFNWGGIAFFRDGNPITELVFEQETKK